MNTTLFISIVLGVIALFCARSAVIYIKNRGLNKDERTMLPIALLFFIGLGIGICFALCKRCIFTEISDTLPIYVIVLAVYFVFGFIINAAYKVAGRLSILIGVSLGIAIGMAIFYTYFIGLGIVIIVFLLSYILNRHIHRD
jgi:hypothetical protein